VKEAVLKQHGFTKLVMERLLLVGASAAFAALLGLGNHRSGSYAAVAIATADGTTTGAADTAGTASFAAIAASSLGADNLGCR
jgi:hypothetical protein